MPTPDDKPENHTDLQPDEHVTPEPASDTVISADAINRAIRMAADAAEDDMAAQDASGEDEAFAAGHADAADALAALRNDYETKISELKDQLLRAVAETENVRRRSARDVEETGKYAISGFARDMITVAENLYLALDNVPEEQRGEDNLLKSLAEGVEMTLRELLNAFEKHAIQRIYPLGEKFDHNRHQAVSQVEDPQKEPNTVLHVMQAGYTIGERLLRPAMVVVSKQGTPEQKLDTQA